MYQLRVFLLMAGMTALYTALGGYFGGPPPAMFKLFRTHPPTEERIGKLEEFATEQGLPR